MQQPQAILSFSDQLYQRFLRAYPAEYRRGFGEEMAQVFRDICREVYEQRGLAGFLELWLATLLDLIKTALEERIKETTNMTKEKFVRLSGWGLMLALLLIWLGFKATEISAAKFHSLSDPYLKGNYFADPFGGGDLLYEAAPIVLIACGCLFYTIGLIGLRLQYGRRSGFLGNAGLILAIASGIVATISIFPMMLVNTNLWWDTWMYSFMLLFAGLLVFGIAALQKRLMRRGNAIPLIVGVWFPIMYLLDLTGVTTDDLGYIWNITNWLVVAGSVTLGYLLQSEANSMETAATA